MKIKPLSFIALLAALFGICQSTLAVEGYESMPTGVPFYFAVQGASTPLYLHAKGGAKLAAPTTLQACPGNASNPLLCQWILEASKEKPGSYYIKSADADLYLSGWGNQKGGDDLKLHACPKKENHPNCQWVFELSTEIPGTYYIRSTDSHMYASAWGNSQTGDAGRLSACPKDGTNPNCQWKLEPASSQARSANIVKAKSTEYVDLSFVEKINLSDGSFLGNFIQTDIRKWLEQDGKGNERTWYETHRDQWSVHLLSKTANAGFAKIKLDLYKKQIKYSDDNTPESVLYNFGSHDEKTTGRMVNLVVFSDGNGEELGEYSKEYDKYWLELGRNGSVFRFEETDRDDWSVYLYDGSRGVSLLLDLHRKKVGFKVPEDNKDDKYKDLYNISDSYSLKDSSRPGIFTFSGTGQSYTKKGLESGLQLRGQSLVSAKEFETANHKIQNGQCAILTGKAEGSASANSVSGQAGLALLNCSYKVADGVAIDVVVLEAGCSADLGGKGYGGAKCEAVSFSETITFDLGAGVETKYEVKGPATEACGSLTLDRMCANAGATLASESFEMTSANGSGFGISCEAGVGAGLSGGIEDGVLSFGIEAKFLAGVGFNISISGDDVVSSAEAAYGLGETGYTIVSGEIKVMSESLAKEFDLENTGIEVVNAVASTASDVEGGVNYFTKHATKTLGDVAVEVGNVFDTSTW